MTDALYAPLPEREAGAGGQDWFTADQMRAYADATCSLRGGQIPDGWKLVPVDPTYAMGKAAADAWLGRPHSTRSSPPTQQPQRRL